MNSYDLKCMTKTKVIQEALNINNIYIRFQKFLTTINNVI